MPDFVYDIPPKTLALYFAIFALGTMFLGLLIVKPIMRVLIGAGPRFNESISYATAGFNLFYGLLLGLLVVSAYQNSDRVKQAILNEATTVAAIYAAMDAYPEPARTDVKAMLRDYVLFTIYKDWDSHRNGEFLNGGANRANAIRKVLSRYEPDTAGKQIFHTEVVSSFQDFIRARQQRLTAVITRIPDVLWYAVLVGAAINLLLLILLRMPFRQQFTLGAITAFFLGVILFVIVTLDDPLRGAAGLEPEPLKLLWERTMVWDEPQQ